MNIFMNSKGQYLTWREESTRANPALTYEWVDNINHATTAVSIPARAHPKWKHDDNPSKDVVAVLEAEVVRTVTIKGMAPF